MINKGMFNFDAWQDDINFSWYVGNYSINSGEEIANNFNELDKIHNTNSKRDIEKFLKNRNTLFINCYINDKKELINTGTFKEYNPLEIDDLFLRFAYINTKDDKDILT